MERSSLVLLTKLANLSEREFLIKKFVMSPLY